jgi:hypothetical protein
MSATETGAPNAGGIDPGSDAPTATFSQNMPDAAPASPHSGSSSDPSSGFLTSDDALLHYARQLLRTRRLLLNGLQRRNLHAADAQWLVERLMAGLAERPDTTPDDLPEAAHFHAVAGWSAAVHQMQLQPHRSCAPLGAPAEDGLRGPALPIPTWAELEQLRQRVAALARRLPHTPQSLSL